MKQSLTNTLDMEKCASQVGSRFDLVLIAAMRTRELRKGFKPMVNTPNGPVVTALQEIEAGFIGREYLKKIR